jgi:hypothetical protein
VQGWYSANSLIPTPCTIRVHQSGPRGHSILSKRAQRCSYGSAQLTALSSAAAQVPLKQEKGQGKAHRDTLKRHELPVGFASLSARTNAAVLQPQKHICLHSFTNQLVMVCLQSRQNPLADVLYTRLALGFATGNSGYLHNQNEIIVMCPQIKGGREAGTPPQICLA